MSGMVDRGAKSRQVPKMIWFKSERQKLAEIETKSAVKGTVMENNKNFYPTNLHDFEAHANFKIPSTSASAGFGDSSSSDANNFFSRRYGGGGGGGVFFAQALGETTPNRWASSLFSDVDPRDLNFYVPVVAGILVILWISSCLVYKKTGDRRKRTSGLVGRVGGGDRLQASASSPVAVAIRNVRGRRARTGKAKAEAPPGSPGVRLSSPDKVWFSTPTRETPIRVQRIVASDIVPPFSVNIRAFQSEETGRQRNKVKAMKEAREVTKAATATAAAGRALSSSSLQAQRTQARGSNKSSTGSIVSSGVTSPVVDKGKGKAPAPSPRVRSASSSKKEKMSRQKPAELSRAELALSPRHASVKRGGITRPTPSPENTGPVVKRVAVASKNIKDDTATTRVPTTKMRNSGRRTLPLAPGPLESSRGRNIVTTMAGEKAKGGVALSPLNTSSKGEASSLLETARRETQLETKSAAKVRADKLTGASGGGCSTSRNERTLKSTKRTNERTLKSDEGLEGDEDKRSNKRGKKRASKGAVDDSHRRSNRLATKRPIDGDGDGNASSTRSTKRDKKRSGENDEDSHRDGGVSRGAKRGSTGDIAPVEHAKRSKRNAGP